MTPPAVFEEEARRFPDLFEPYIVRLEQTAIDDHDGRVRIMREALRNTLKYRYPLKGEE